MGKDDIKVDIAEEFDKMIGDQVNESVRFLAEKYEIEEWEILDIYRDYLVYMEYKKQCVINEE